jgi:hypothetical protein
LRKEGKVPVEIPEELELNIEVHIKHTKEAKESLLTK